MHGAGAGAARTLAQDDKCADPCYTWDEAKTTLGSNRCKTSCECDGARTCSKSGFCEGTARAKGCGGFHARLLHKPDDSSLVTRPFTSVLGTLQRFLPLLDGT